FYRGIAFKQCNDSPKAGIPISLISQLLQEQRHVIIAISLRAGIAGRENAWLAIQCRHLQACVISKAGHIKVSENKFGLLPGVVLESEKIFRQFSIETDLVQAQ